MALTPSLALSHLQPSRDSLGSEPDLAKPRSYIQAGADSEPWPSQADPYPRPYTLDGADPEYQPS